MSIERSGGPHGILRYATAPGSSSFTEFVAAASPEVLPGRMGDVGAAPHGTTIVAAVYADGVIMAGDRRATAGNLIAQRDIEKVFAADDYTLVGIAGVAGLAVEIVRLYQVELEHYEKIEGTQLTLDGKANRLATMIRGNLGQAMQGLAVVPLFAGYDVDARDPADAARIFSFDVTGGRYPEQYHHCVGSGSLFARGALKKLWRPNLDPRRGRARRRRGPLRRGRRRLGHRRTRHHPPDLSRRHDRDRGRLRADRRRRARHDGARHPHRPRIPSGCLTLGASEPHQGDHAMSMPFYASAEQIMRDRSEYARKGIARGRGVVVLTYADGVLFVAENASSALHKVSEIYDRIGFAGVGKYNEYENLRVAGIRLADLRGYSYDRRDVTARALANAYAQTLGSIFTEQQKPYEVEICVAEVGDSAESDQIYRLTYDGTIVDEPEFLAMGGQADALTNEVRTRFAAGLDLRAALGVAVGALGSTGGTNGAPRALPAGQLEVATLDRNRGKRKFRRLTGAALTELLPAPDAPVDEPPPGDDSSDAPGDAAGLTVTPATTLPFSTRTATLASGRRRRALEHLAGHRVVLRAVARAVELGLRGFHRAAHVRADRAEAGRGGGCRPGHHAGLAARQLHRHGLADGDVGERGQDVGRSRLRRAVRLAARPMNRPMLRTCATARPTSSRPAVRGGGAGREQHAAGDVRIKAHMSDYGCPVRPVQAVEIWFNVQQH